MKEMIKRCLSLGFSLSVVVLAGFRYVKGPVGGTEASGKFLRKAPGPLDRAPEPPKTSPATTFTGTVVRDRGRFALREEDGSLYPLDSTGRAWPFEGEDVKILGQVDGATKMLHIVAIETVEDAMEPAQQRRAEAV
jgi:hypothetical protein